MTWRQPLFVPVDLGPLTYVVASRDDTVLAEVVAHRHARRIEPNLLLAELTADEVTSMRRQYAGRALIAKDPPASPFSS